MKKKIKEYFEGTPQDPVVTHTILYYSGAAKENGDWHCQEDDTTVSIQDIWDLALESNLNGNLEPILENEYATVVRDRGFTKFSVIFFW